ncbi:MAG TPA: hypothetical protein VE965_02850, partial [Gammaproteobacteria bacterium]|nr:hypothetical protein [Gammaproteobacteria bacterium]
MHGDHRTPARSLALQAHHAPVEIDDASNQGQTQPKSPVLPRQVLARLAKRLEHVLEHVGRDADTAVANGQNGYGPFQGKAECDGPPGGGKLAGIVQQIAQYLGQTDSIAEHPKRLFGQLKVKAQVACLEQ